MTTRFNRLYFLAVICLVTTLFSCSNEATDSGKKQIRFMFWGGFKELDIWEALEKKYEAMYPDVDLVLEYTPAGMGDYDKKIHLGLKGGTIPDLFAVDDDLYPTYAVGGNLENLEPYIQRDAVELKLEDFIPTSMETFTYEGIRYAMPWDGFSTQIIFNKTIFDNAGLPYPDSAWTWDDFCYTAWLLTRDYDSDGFIDQYGGDIGFGYLDTENIIWAFGGDIMDKERKHFIMDSPEAIQAMRYVLDLKYKYSVQPKSEEMSALPSEIMLLTNRLAMRLAPCYVMLNLFTAFEQSGMRWDIAYMPTGPSGKKGSRVSWDGVAMYSGTKYKQECWNVIKCILSSEIQQRIGALKRAVPVRFSDAYASFADSTTEQHEERYIIGFQYGSVSPITDRVKKMSDLIGTYMDRLSIDRPQDPLIRKKLIEINDLTDKKDRASFDALKRLNYRYEVEPYEIFLPVIKNGDTLIVLKYSIIKGAKKVPKIPRGKKFETYTYKLVHGDTIDIFKPRIFSKDTLLVFDHRLLNGRRTDKFTPPIEKGNMFQFFQHHIRQKHRVDVVQGRVVNGDTTDFGLNYLQEEVFGHR
ncbi:sugar ABC transporter substrate-binding protein [candidate division KSB1 bacterium]|nr:sugar ABC transporter substrate-binding protein [candidate division KSB1 bacterium]